MRELQIKELMHVSGGDLSEVAPYALAGVACLTVSSTLISILCGGLSPPVVDALAPLGALLLWGIYLVTQN